MSNLIAKPVVDNAFWIVTDGQKKVGNVEATTDGFSLKLNGSTLHYADTQSISNTTNIQFQTLPNNTKKNSIIDRLDFPVFNVMYDVQRKMMIFTKEQHSKCFYVAGWVALKKESEYEAVFCPKYIFVQRNPYQGPFDTKEETEQAMKVEHLS